MASEDQLPVAPHTASEFYTWLWYQSEKNESRFDLGGDIGKIELWVDDRLAFRLPDSPKPSAVLTGENPSTSMEARAALLGGKVVHDLRLAIRRDDREFGVTLKGATLDLQRAKIPQAIEGTSEEALHDRMFLYEELTAILGALFREFAKLRTSKAWGKTTLPAIRKWVAAQT